MQRYSVEPPLPSGLSLDPKSGILAGTPGVATRSTTYTITATNPHGSSSFTVNVVVFPPDGELGNLVVNLASGSADSGWVTDRFGNAIVGLGSVAAPIPHPLQRAIESAEAGDVLRVGPGTVRPFSIDFKTLGHQSRDIHFLNSTAQHPLILMGDASGGTVVAAPVNGTGGGALFSSAQVGAGHLHFVHFRFLQNWIGIELGSDTLAANNVTEDAAEGFWFVHCEIDGRYNYCKTCETSTIVSQFPPAWNRHFICRLLNAGRCCICCHNRQMPKQKSAWKRSIRRDSLWQKQMGRVRLRVERRACNRHPDSRYSYGSCIFDIKLVNSDKRCLTC